MNPYSQYDYRDSDVWSHMARMHDDLDYGSLDAPDVLPQGSHVNHPKMNGATRNFVTMSRVERD